MALPPKVCPECGEEYLHFASVCSQCDVELVLAEELRPAPGGELPPIAELQLLRTAGGAWAVGLSECLRGARIPHRVDSLATEDPRTAGAFGVWVRAEDLEAARAIDLDHARAQVPDIPEGFDASVRDVDAQAGGDDVCPACGGGVAADADECGSCGLYLGQPD